MAIQFVFRENSTSIFSDYETKRTYMKSVTTHQNKKGIIHFLTEVWGILEIG